MWKLPLTRALQYYHAALRYAGEWTVPVDPTSATDKMQAAQDAITKLTSSVDEEDDLF